jgi:hypothetical protein
MFWRGESMLITAKKKFPPSSTMPVEMIYLDENPFLKVKDSERPKGHFWIVPMRTGGDKIFYGTGVAYMAGFCN